MPTFYACTSPVTRYCACSPEKVIGELAADLSRIMGRLHEEVLTEVVAAVKPAPTLSPAEPTRIADSLGDQASGGN